MVERVRRLKMRNSQAPDLRGAHLMHAYYIRMQLTCRFMQNIKTMRAHLFDGMT